jgi:hypothetical protein
MLFPFWKGYCMNSDVDRISEKAGPMLTRYAQLPANHDDKYFIMPKSSEKLEELYCAYVSGQIPGRSGFSSIETIWIGITCDIRWEFHYRCVDGLKFFIDEFLRQFNSFVSAVDSFHDQSFFEVLRSKMKDSLGLFIVNAESAIESDLNLTRESICLPYTVCEIDKILNASRNFQDIKLAELYRTHYLTDEFRNSPEYQAMYRAIAKTFEDGIFITDLCTKE